MLSAIRQRSIQAARFSSFSNARPLARCFSVDGKIPNDSEQQTGRRKYELDAESTGDVGFDRSPIVPPAGAGSKTNPIMVPSNYDERQVGFEDPSSHQLQWFTLKNGPLHYIPTIDKYFKLEKL
mmetsp:Transcript_30/g.28  ORF Transcript_30/g.28 Transcript_30/m.28 type:complete len:124 (+) Transcript_30:117-488(+)